MGNCNPGVLPVCNADVSSAYTYDYYYQFKLHKQTKNTKKRQIELKNHEIRFCMRGLLDDEHCGNSLRDHPSENDKKQSDVGQLNIQGWMDG